MRKRGRERIEEKSDEGTTHNEGIPTFYISHLKQQHGWWLYVFVWYRNIAQQFG